MDVTRIVPSDLLRVGSLSSSIGRAVGAQLLAAAENWARGQGCIEMASDTGVDNTVSQEVHEALGFQVVDRCVHYRKPL
jgi:aminoglycoside 6'-N-acetyltransferase I